jgi:hypothetical protein
MIRAVLTGFRDYLGGDLPSMDELRAIVEKTDIGCKDRFARDDALEPLD